MTEPASPASRELLDAAGESLRQGEQLLSILDDDAYQRRLPEVFHASIGSHYRHCLDHFRLLLESLPGSVVNYDLRERGTRLETDRFAALNATRALIEAYASLSPALVTQPIGVICQTSSRTAGSQSAASSVGREIMYAVAHAVHHHALIGIMGGLMGIALPPGFGVAPSTLKHQQAAAAAGA